MGKRRQTTDDAPALRRDAEARVARWVWATGPLHDLRPFWPERLGIARGKTLARAPTKRAGRYAYGFDADGRIVVERHHASLAGQFHEEIFRHGVDRIEVAIIGQGDDAVGATAVLELRDGRPSAYERIGDGWRIRERYSYAGDRMARIETVDTRDGAPPEHRDYVLAWQGDGAEATLRAIACASAGGVPYPVYEAPDPSTARQPSLASLARALERLLVELVPRVVARAAITEPAYGVALVFDDDGTPLPPELAVGLERQRLAWIAAHREGAQAYLWSPEDFERFDDGTLALDDAALLAAAKAYLGRLDPDVLEARAVALLARVARRLQALDWRGLLPVTEDFVVAPVRLSGGIAAAR